MPIASKGLVKYAFAALISEFIFIALISHIWPVRRRTGKILRNVSNDELILADSQGCVFGNVGMHVALIKAQSFGKVMIGESRDEASWAQLVPMHP